MKWDDGLDARYLDYFKEDPIARKYHHHKLTFSTMYMNNENTCCHYLMTKLYTEKAV